MADNVKEYNQFYEMLNVLVRIDKFTTKLMFKRDVKIIATDNVSYRKNFN